MYFKKRKNIFVYLLFNNDSKLFLFTHIISLTYMIE